ncbi:MAG: insulinase family protein, partial [Acidobacteria bacterium]|nr:insulinase family protein [Acidobacteriota bacterium]
MTFVDRKQVPAALDPAPFNIPEPFYSRLANELKVVVSEDSRLPLVSLRLAFLSGDAAEPRDQLGITSAMAAMLTEGSENYSSRQLAESIERLGASLTVSASDDFTILAASALSIYTSDILRLVEEVLFRPVFPESELDLYRRNTIENLKFQRSQPNFLANEQVGRTIYGDHPYSVAAPSVADIERLERKMLVN